MKKSALALVGAALALSTLSFADDCNCNIFGRDISSEMPQIEREQISPEEFGFKKLPDVAQYKNADWSNIIGVAKGITLEEALKIARKNPEIAFFFYTKGWQMVLEKENGDYRVFRSGDAVFFSGQPWWGTAPDLADGYIRS